VTRRLFFIILGIVLLGWGLFLGIRSHQVHYSTVSRGTIAHYLADEDQHTGYLQMDGSSTLYLVNETDFQPVINGTSTFQDGMSISLVYRPDQTTNIDAQSTLGTHLQGDAYTVMALTLYNDNGQVQQQFVSSTYRSNPSGFYENDWPAGAALAAVGLVILVLAFLLGRSRQVPMAGMPGAPFPGSAPGSQYTGSYPPQGYGQYPQQAPPQDPRYPPSWPGA
jgi:hypothetical protein